MCLATVYKESDDTVICRNVSKILVEGRSRKQHCKITVRLMIRS